MMPKVIDLAAVTLENLTDREITAAWVFHDGRLILRIYEHEQRSAAGLIIPKRGQKPLLN